MSALPPVVVSGEPNMTPIFMRIWLMKMTMVLVFLIVPVSLRSAWLIRRACRPGSESPISPSISALGVSAATESMTTRSTEAERTSASTISSACSPVSGWRDQQLLQVDAELLRVLHVERVLGVDEGAGAAELLHLGDDLQGERGLAARLRAVDLDDPAARQAADAERDVEAERAGGDDLDVVDDLALAEAHDRALAELLLDLRQGRLQGLGFFGVEGLDGCIHGGGSWGCGNYPE